MAKSMKIAIGAIAALAAIAVILTLWGSMQAPVLEDETLVEGTPERAGELPIAQASADHAVDEGVIMTLGGSADTYVLVGEEYLEAGCHAVDPDAVGDYDITSSVAVFGEVDASTVGDYTLTYTATTENDEVATVERRVHVVDSFDGGKAATIPVFMYHYLYDPADPPANIDANYLSIEDLEDHLQYLTKNDYYYPSYQEIRAFAEGTHSLPAKSATLTFDDGAWEVYTTGGDLFRQYEVPATMFLICENADIPDLCLSQANPYISFQSHTYKMHNGGSGIGRGGLIHAFTKDQIIDDVKTAQDILGTTEAVAYPFGDNNETAWAALEEADTQCAFTIENRRIKPGDNPMALPRLRVSNGNGADTFAALVAADPA